MTAASNALNFLAYQQELMNAKQRQAEKAKLSKMVQQSKQKLQQLQAAAQNVRFSGCIGSVNAHEYNLGSRQS
jgi:hypothetical protein